MEDLNTRELNLELYKKFQYIHLTPKPEGKLTKDQQILEIYKCKYNILYYLLNYHRIPLPGGGSTNLAMNDKLKTVALLFQSSVPHIFQTARQSSKTTIEISCIAWYTNFWNNVKIMMFNMKAADNKKNLSDIKKMIALLPSWMRSYNPKVDPNNVEKFKNGIESEINLLSIDRQNPDATGRGNTGAIYLDEFGFLHNIHIAYSPLSFIYANYSRIAKSNYVPAPFCITSTPADPIAPEGELFMQMWFRSPIVEFEDIKDKLPHEIFDYVDSLSEHRMARVYQNWFEYPDRCEKELYDETNENNILHLLTDPFVDLKELEKYSKPAVDYLKQVRSTCKTKTQLRREVYCEFLSVADQTIFDEDFIEAIPRLKPIKEIKMPHAVSGNLKLFEDHNPDVIKNNNYAICIDPAYRVKGDFAGIVVFNLETNSIEATAKLQLGKINNLVDVVKFVDSIYPTSVIIIEKNNFGQAVIETLLEDYKISKKLYYSYGNKDPNKMSSMQRIDNKVFGIQTDKSSRPKMIDCLVKYVLEFPDKLKSPDIINELIYLQEKKNGRIEAAAGQHDDMVMALSFILYLLEYKAKELRKFKKLSVEDAIHVSTIANFNTDEYKENDIYKRLKMQGYDLNQTANIDHLDQFKTNHTSSSSMLSLITSLNNWN